MSKLFKPGSSEAAESYDWSHGETIEPTEVATLLNERDEAPEPTPAEPEPPPEPEPEPPPVDLDHIRKQAFEEGFQAGRETTEKSCEQAFAERLQHFGGIVEQATRFKETLRGEVEAEVVDLAFAVARRIVRRELHVDPETTIGVVKAGMERASKSEVRRIRVHPSNLEMVRAEIDSGVDVVADDSIEPGGAVFETPEGNLDARIQTQLEEIERGLADR